MSNLADEMHIAALFLRQSGGSARRIQLLSDVSTARKCFLRHLIFDGKAHQFPLFRRKGIPDSAWNGADFATGIGVPAAYVTDSEKGAGLVREVRRAAMQGPGVANEDVAGFERHGMQRNFTGFNGSHCLLAQHRVRTRRDFDGSVRGSDRAQAKADDEHV